MACFTSLRRRQRNARSGAPSRPLWQPDRRLSVAIAALWTTCGALVAAAQPLYWDANGPAPGAGGGGGPWDADTERWSPNIAGVAPTGVWAAGSTAVFSAGADAIGLNPITVPPLFVVPGVEGINFEEGLVLINAGGVGSGLTLVAPAPLMNPVIDVGPAAAAQVFVPIGGAVGLTKTGTGTLVLSAANTYNGVTAVNAGPLILAGAGAWGPVFGGGGADVLGGRLHFQYGAGANPAPAIQAALTAGYAMAPRFSAGPIFTTNPPAPGIGLGWRDVPAATVVTVAYTFYGDANLDGQIDIVDLGILATNWQAAGVWGDADFDYSGFVDIVDLGMLATNWQQGVGNPLGPQSFSDALAAMGLPLTAVPEPTTAALIIVTLAGVTSRHPRRQ